MRVLAAEDGVQLDHVALPGERVEVVRHRHQVGFRRQLVGGVAPVGIGENAELALLDEGLHLLLHVGEVAGRRLRIAGDRLRQCRRRRRIGLQRRHHVDPVERVQVIEVHHVVVHILRRDHQVADQLRVLRQGVVRNGAMQRVFNRAHRGDSMHQRADAADALGERPGIAGIAPAQDDLDATHHGAGGIRTGDLAAGVGFGLDAQVAFDAGDGVNDNALCCGHNVWLLTTWLPLAAIVPGCVRRSFRSGRSPGYPSGNARALPPERCGSWRRPSPPDPV